MVTFLMRVDRRGFDCFHLGLGPGQLLWRVELYRNGVLVGEFNEEGRRDSVGQYYWHSGKVYTGEYRNGKRHGHGTGTYASGDVYSGQWVNNALKGRTFSNRAKDRIAAARERERRFEEEMEWEEEMNRQLRRRVHGYVHQGLLRRDQRSPPALNERRRHGRQGRGTVRRPATALHGPLRGQARRQQHVCLVPALGQGAGQLRSPTQPMQPLIVPAAKSAVSVDIPSQASDTRGNSFSSIVAPGA